MRGRKPLLGLVVVMLLGVAPGRALACSCVWAGPFTKVALGADLVLLGEVRSHDRHSMEVAVVEVFRGTEARRTIRVWGDDGALCRPYVSAFPRGTRWLFAVKAMSEQPHGNHLIHRRLASQPGQVDYAISVCGDFWLEARGDQAVGRITIAEHGRTLESAPLAEVLAWLRSGGVTALPTPRPVSR